MSREYGKVKFFKQDAGWGFIERVPEPDIFFHQKNVLGAVKMGDKVEFEIEQGKKGLNAVRVMKVY